MTLPTSDFILSFLISVIISFLIFKFLNKKLQKYINVPFGPQVVHEGNILRLGGLSLFLTFIFLALKSTSNDNNLFLWYFVISTPVFLFGIFEDFTQSISPKIRLLGASISALLCILIYKISVTSVGINSIDLILGNKFISFIFTMICIVFIVNAFNIIDGLNGLSLLSAILCLTTIGVIAYDVNDLEIFCMSFLLISSLLGILLFNFPLGFLFIGDSGAYIIGLLVSTLVIILVERYSTLSPFLAASILIYPSYELLRTFVRRLISRKNILRPDNEHLHSIIFRYNSIRYLLKPLKVNILSSVEIIIFQTIYFIFLMNYYVNEKFIIIGIIAFITIYELIYYSAYKVVIKKELQ